MSAYKHVQPVVAPERAFKLKDPVVAWPHVGQGAHNATGIKQRGLCGNGFLKNT